MLCSKCSNPITSGSSFEGNLQTGEFWHRGTELRQAQGYSGQLGCPVGAEQCLENLGIALAQGWLSTVQIKPFNINESKWAKFKSVMGVTS